MRAWFVVLVGVLGGASLLLAPACGGGGGGTGPLVLADPFDGAYHWVQQIGDAGPPLRGTCVWGQVTSDGAGLVTGGTRYSISNGVLSGPTAVAPFTYTILAQRRLRWFLGSIPFAEGGVSADGEHVIVGSVTAGTDPSIALLTRPPTGLSTATLNGPYHYATFFTSPGGGSDGVIWGVADFDGAGGVDFTLWTNLDGTVSGPVTVSEAYFLSSNGTLLFSVGALTFGGVVRQDGDVAFLGGSTVVGGVATTGILIRHSTGATAASFSGPYHVVSMTAQAAALPAVNWISFTGTMTSNGAGSMSRGELTIVSDDGTAATVPAGGPPISYTTAPNGGMVLGGGSAVGAISPDGGVAALVGGTTPGSDLVMWVMLR